MSLKINFYLESRKGNEKNLPINMLVWFDGSRLKYYTGYRIDFGKWIKEDQEIRKNNVNEDGLTSSFINQKLLSLKTEAARIYNQHDSNNIPLTIEIFRTELKVFDKKSSVKANNQTIGYYIEVYKSLITVSPGMLKQIEVSFKHFTTFLNSDRNIKDISHDTMTLFENYLRDTKSKGNNTIVANLKRLRTFFRYAETREWIKTNPFKKYKIESEKYGKPIALTKNEVDLIYAKKLPDKSKLDKVRDIFVFQCCIGCRVSDLLRLTNANIINESVVYVPTKTKEENPSSVSIPINEKARHILNKYAGSDILLPLISDVKYNLYLKELFKECEITRQVIRLNPLTGKEESVSLAKIASSHLARRTFISILHKKAKDSVIASMTGHSKTSKAFSRYYDIEEEQKTEVINLI